MKKLKSYTVNIDMSWSQDIDVKAINAKKAKKLAFEKFKKKAKMKDFNINHEINDL